MKCVKCNKKKAVYKSPGGSGLCADCFDQLKSSDERKLICAKCGCRINDSVFISAISNKVFCSRDCLAKIYGFKIIDE